MTGTTTGPRNDGRVPNQLRPVKIVPDYLKFAEGSVLIRVGDTRVICAATIEDRVPGWMRGKGRGWVTAEYSMLPRAGTERSQREAARGSIGGRTHEIQRLIGRSLRGVIDMSKLGERTITLDCDVIQADGGTRTAAITGAWIALYQALEDAVGREVIAANPIIDEVAAVSVGIVDGEKVLDLDYQNDVGADVDLNVVMSGRGLLVEVQGTAEGAPFTRDDLNDLLDLAGTGIAELHDMQRRAVAS